MPFPIGADVLVRPLGNRPGVVVEIDRRNRHRVRMGAALVWCEEHDLAAVTVSKSARRRAARERPPVGARRRPEFAPPAGSSVGKLSVARIDLHGLTVEEAMARTVTAIDRALQGGADAIEIVHGKGSGRIRAALHRLLGTLPVIASFAVDERNPGVTHARF